MIKIIRSSFIIVLILCQLLITGCSNKNTENTYRTIDENAVEEINIEILNESIIPEGISYSLKLTNESNHIIVQNNVYVSFPISNEDGTGKTMNKCKVEATGNKLYISPGDEVVLYVFIQTENFYSNEYLQIENPYIQVVGYFDELNELNRFGIYGGFKYFDKDFESKWEKNKHN